LCLYFMGLNLSSRQIALELGLDASDVQAMTEQLRRGLLAKAQAVAKRGGSDAAAGWQARRDAARWRRTSRPSSA